MERAQPGTVASSHLIKRMCASVFSYYHTENVTNRGYVSCTVPSLAPTEAPWWRCDGERHGSSSLIPLQAVRGLRLEHPELGPKPLPAKLREQQPDLAAGNKEVREALATLKAEESKTPEDAAAAPPAATECRDQPRLLRLRPAAVGDGRRPGEASSLPDLPQAEGADDVLVLRQLPGDAYQRHSMYDKAVKRQRKLDDGGVRQQQNREVAEREARRAAQTGNPNAFEELMAEGTRYLSKEDWRRAASAYREAIALRPDEPVAYFNLGAALFNSAHAVEAAQRYLEARERLPVGSERWAVATAWSFSMLAQEVCAEVANPEWWNDEGLKALSAMVVRAAPDDLQANQMRAEVLCGRLSALEAGTRSAVELREAGCGAVPCSGGGGKHTLRRHCGPVPQAQPGRAAS